MFPRLAFLLLSAVVCVTPYEAPKEFVLPLMDSETQPVATATPQQLLGLSMHSAARLAAEYINNNTLGILQNTTLILDSVSDHNTPAIGVSKMVEFADRGHTFVVGSPFSAVAVQTGIVGSVYGVAQLSPLAGAAILANSKEYPFFSRLGSDTVDMAQVMKETILHYGSLAGIGWNQVAVIVQLTDFTIDIASAFVTNAQPQLEVLVYQSFLPGRGMDILVELNEIKKSGARIILGLIFSDWLDFLSACDSVGLIGEQYVYFGVPTLRSSPLVGDTNLSRGVLIPYTGTPVPTAEFMEFAKLWQSVDPMEYPLAGPGTFPTPFAAKNFDMIVTAAKAIDILNSKEFLDGRRIPAEEWSATIREISFNGASGPIVFDPDGNIIEELGILYFSPENGWVRAGNYSVEQGYKELSPIVWYSNSTELPDLDVRPPIDYWSCHAKERGYDETGKQIILQTPDGSDVDDIDYSYHCDLFIDCKNLSDETVDCSTNYIIIYALFGVITGLLILACFFLILFVIIFGLILKYSRVRNRSPVFLIIQLLSAILGFTSVYTWFGKPHPVACGFQAWLLGLSTVSMISSLSVKNFRIWRIFRFPLKKTKVTDWELLVYWGITIFPAVIILLLWTIISTPSAALKTRDGQKHYVCTTGGFTGEPGGLIFFSILVAYNAVILLFGVFISFAVQNVPSMFNESKLLKVSIYNLGFLAIIIIPVYFVLIPFDPFSAWIIRTIAIIYAFGATLMLQFIPILGGIFILDKGSDRFATNTMFVNRSTT